MWSEGLWKNLRIGNNQMNEKKVPRDMKKFRGSGIRSEEFREKFEYKKRGPRNMKKKKKEKMEQGLYNLEIIQGQGTRRKVLRRIFQVLKYGLRGLEKI
jgi:hypothetical protein